MITLLRKPSTWLLSLVAVAIALFFVFIVPNYRLYIVDSGSMRPTIPIGSAVIVDKSPVHVGEVITFHRLADGALVTHRLIEIKQDGTLVTKGDANNAPDLGSIPRGNVVGHVVAAPRDVGSVIHMLFHTPLGYGLDAMILLVMTLLLSGSSNKQPPRHHGRARARGGAS